MSEEKREQKEITTPVGKNKLVINAWLNGMEKRDLRKVFYGGMKVGVKGQEPNISDIDMTVLMEKAEDLAIKLIVVSVDGKKDDVLGSILKMQDRDYSFVIAEINKISADKDFTKPE